MTISLCLLLVSLMPRADFHWNRPQSQFITTCAAPGGPTQYIDFEGAVRAGKSTPCVAKLARYAQQYPGIHMAACRWTQDALDAQIKPLWRMMAAQRGLQLQWHSDEGYDEVVGTGARLYLRGLHASEDSQRYSKLAGLTLALIWIDQPEEISNTDEDVVLAYIPARLSQVGYPHEVWFTPNPVGNDHWVAQWFPLEGVRPNYHFIHTSIYDNRHILGDEYIRDMEDKHPEGSAFRMRFVDGNRGLGFAGKPVYAGYFSRVLRRGDVKLPWHVQPSVPYDRRFPIFEGWDFGYSHPAVLWSQFVNGQWRILAELQGTNESADAFGDRAVQLRGELFPQAFRFESVCDPAGFAKGAGLQGTVADLFAKKGVFFAAYDEVKGYNAPQVESNAIQTTMRILRNTVGQGQPAFVVDQRCTMFGLGLEAGYIWSDRQLEGSMGGIKVPDKKRDTEYNHLQDCWLYTLLRFGGASMTFEQAERYAAKQAKQAERRAQADPAEKFTWSPRRNGRGGYG
jgi:hypothetical protein